MSCSSGLSPVRAKKTRKDKQDEIRDTPIGTKHRHSQTTKTMTIRKT